MQRRSERCRGRSLHLLGLRDWRMVRVMVRGGDGGKEAGEVRVEERVDWKCVG